jgi:hypothetical protein
MRSAINFMRYRLIVLVGSRVRGWSAKLPLHIKEGLPVIREQLDSASENHVRGIPALRPDGARFMFRENLAGWVGGWPVAISPSPPHTRSEISLFRIGPRFHSGSLASSS